jgi:hypothetical protein
MKLQNTDMSHKDDKTTSYFHYVHGVSKWWKKREETTKYTHIQPISAESQVLRYSKIGNIAPYYLSLPPGYAILRNNGSHREELLHDWVNKNNFMPQCSEYGHFWSKSKEIHAEGKQRVADAKYDCVASSVQTDSCETCKFTTIHKLEHEECPKLSYFQRPRTMMKPLQCLVV